MISYEIHTINEFGSRRLAIHFLNAGEPLPRQSVVLPVGQVRTARKDKDGNICLLEISLGKAQDNPHDKWPVEQTLHWIPKMGLKISDEDVTEIRRLFPITWYRTGDYHADCPFPGDTMCDNCGEHKAHGFWTGDKPRYDKYAPFAYEGIWCHCCMWQAQLEYAQAELAKVTARIPRLQAKLAAGCKEKETAGAEDDTAGAEDDEG